MKLFSKIIFPSAILVLFDIAMMKSRAILFTLLISSLLLNNRSNLPRLVSFRNAVAHLYCHK